MGQHHILGISGSLRQDSLNSKLVREAARVYGAARYEEADLNLPLYSGDLQDAQGIPPEVRKLSDQIIAADAVVISGPEYNKSISGVLKNALDWVSRTKDWPFKHKPVAIMSVTSGASGGLMTQAALRLCLYSFRPRLLQGPSVLIGGGTRAFHPDGSLVDQRQAATLKELMEELHDEVLRQGAVVKG